MFQRILVPLDGSKSAERAIPVAAQLARTSGGTVILIHVDPPTEFLQAGVIATPSVAEEVFGIDLADAQRYLAEQSVSPDLKGISTETDVLFGSPATTILSVATSTHADMIVMCSHSYHSNRGHTDTRYRLLGSIAGKVIDNASIAVLLLREEDSMPLGPHVDDTRPLRILVPLDGSVHAKAALVPAAYLVAALATPEQGAIHLVRVAKLSVMADTEERERLLYRAKRYLEATVEQIREGYVAPSIAHLRLPVTWSVAFDTDVAGAIVRVAENGEDAAGTGIFGGCDVIAMATHGSGGLERWATGSIAARVLRLTNLPLLLVRPSSTIEVKE